MVSKLHLATQETHRESRKVNKNLLGGLFVSDSLVCSKVRFLLIDWVRGPGFVES